MCFATQLFPRVDGFQVSKIVLFTLLLKKLYQYHSVSHTRSHARTSLSVPPAASTASHWRPDGGSAVCRGPSAGSPLPPHISAVAAPGRRWRRLLIGPADMSPPAGRAIVIIPTTGPVQNGRRMRLKPQAASWSSRNVSPLLAGAAGAQEKTY